VKTDKQAETLARPAADISPGEIIIGVITDINAEGKPMVDFNDNPSNQPLAALATVAVHRQHIHRQVALLFANGNPQSPVIMGLIHNPLDALLENHPAENTVSEPADTTALATESEQEVTVDGRRVIIEGKEEVVLKCGDSSITLTRAGKILIRGKYLLSRSSGVNRIMGGSVQVN
jgi:hypothetical protein